MRILAFILLMALGCSPVLGAEKTKTLQEAADQASLAVELARKGEYGFVSSSQLNMIIAARDRISRLAALHTHYDQLNAKQKRVFGHSGERINRLTRRTNGQRLVCKKVVKTGTRLIEAECLTVAQREARSSALRQRVDQIQRPACNNSAIECSGGG